MAVEIERLLAYCDEVLQPGQFQDYCPNGLQVQGRGEVQCLVSGVTASQALIDAAIGRGADALFVHHGYFWRGEDPRVVGMKYQRLAKLIEHGIHLIAYHLPLDAHPQWGNNAQLAARLGIQVQGGLEPGNPYSVGNIGELDQALSAEQFAQRVAKVLGREPLLESVRNAPVSKLAWCTGGAQGYLAQAAERGVDLYITGEASEQTIHEARELGIDFIAAGHHATERYGALAMGEQLAKHFNLDWAFIDIDNPV